MNNSIYNEVVKAYGGTIQMANAMGKTTQVTIWNYRRKGFPKDVVLKILKDHPQFSAEQLLKFEGE